MVLRIFPVDMFSHDKAAETHAKCKDGFFMPSILTYNAIFESLRCKTKQFFRVFKTVVFSL